MTDLFRDVSAFLAKKLSKYRFRHSLAVSRLAADLARRHGWDVEKARMAGLVHDCVKEWSPLELKARVRKRRIRVPDLQFIVDTSPGLLHAYVGADYARAQGWIDSVQAHAVASHTLGAETMNVPDIILFVADSASTDRRYPEAAVIRRLARKNLREGFRAAMAMKLADMAERGKKIHPLPVRVWNRLLDKSRGR